MTISLGRARRSEEQEAEAMGLRSAHVPSRSARTALVYACSGCSSAAQMANRIALWLTRAGHAEMSCIAGVGGGVPGLVRTAQSGRPILALDGCIMHCVKACLARAGVQATTHLTLSDYGVVKRRHQDFDRHQAEQVCTEHVIPALEAMLDETERE